MFVAVVAFVAAAAAVDVGGDSYDTHSLSEKELSTTIYKYKLHYLPTDSFLFPFNLSPRRNFNALRRYTCLKVW